MTIDLRDHELLKCKWKDKRKRSVIRVSDCKSGA